MDPQTPKATENALHTYQELEEKIEELEKKRDASKLELSELLKRFIVLAPMSIDSLIARYKASNRTYEELKAELSIAKELQSLIEPLIEGLKKEQPESKEAPSDAKIAESQSQTAGRGGQKAKRR